VYLQNGGGDLWLTGTLIVLTLGLTDLGRRSSIGRRGCMRATGGRRAAAPGGGSPECSPATAKQASRAPIAAGKTPN
jgi:hypothetical protein